MIASTEREKKRCLFNDFQIQNLMIDKSHQNNRKRNRFCVPDYYLKTKWHAVI